MLRIGVKLPTWFGSAGEFLADAQAYEAAGADSIWLDDELFQPSLAGGGEPADHGPGLDCLVLLAALSAVTSRVRLGTAALVASRRPPALLAQAVTTVEHLSRGRLVVGIDVGGTGWEPARDVSAQQPRSELEELLELLRRIWSGRTLEPYDGYHYRLPALRAAPAQRPGGPPILLNVGSEAALEGVAPLADGFISRAGPNEARAQLVLAGDVRRRKELTAGVELWVEVPAPSGRDPWRDLVAAYGECGATGLIVAHAPNLLDILRNPEDDDRQDLAMAVG